MDAQFTFSFIYLFIYYLALDIFLSREIQNAFKSISFTLNPWRIGCWFRGRGEERTNMCEGRRKKLIAERFLSLEWDETRAERLPAD